VKLSAHFHLVPTAVVSENRLSRSVGRTGENYEILLEYPVAVGISPFNVDVVVQS
jgi:hypothetical protein